MKVADDKLRSMLGVASITSSRTTRRSAIIDTPLQGLKAKGNTAMISTTLRSPCFAIAAAMLLCANIARAEDIEVHIDNFVFEPAQLTVKVGTNSQMDQPDDIPHTVVSAGKFRSKTMDTDRQLLVHVHDSGRLQVFLFAAPAYDGDGQG